MSTAMQIPRSPLRQFVACGMTKYHGIRCVMLAQDTKDPSSPKKVLRAAVLDAFPEIKADALPKGKQAFKGNLARLLELAIPL